LRRTLLRFVLCSAKATKNFNFIPLNNDHEKLVFFFFLCMAFFARAQKTDTKLQNQIADLIKGFHGDIGVYVHDLKHNKIAAINADTIFPTASIVKFPSLSASWIRFKGRALTIISAYYIPILYFMMKAMIFFRGLKTVRPLN